MPKLKVGDKVKLKSDGPCMTVRGYNDEEYTLQENMVDCDWFNKEELERGTFHEDQLISCDKDDKPLGMYSG